MQKITADMLSKLFTTRDVGGDEGRIVYRDTYLHAPDGTTKRSLYEIVSDVAYSLDVTHSFSYEIVSRACDVLAEAYANENTTDVDVDMLAGDIESIVPVYTQVLLRIANPGDYHHIDDAREAFGNELSTTEACAAAWHSLIDLACRNIHKAIVSYNEQ